MSFFPIPVKTQEPLQVTLPPQPQIVSRDVKRDYQFIEPGYRSPGGYYAVPDDTWELLYLYVEFDTTVGLMAGERTPIMVIRDKDDRRMFSSQHCGPVPLHNFMHLVMTPKSTLTPAITDTITGAQAHYWFGAPLPDPCYLNKGDRIYLTDEANGGPVDAVNDRWFLRAVYFRRYNE
jgi:hypothetical protein